MSTSVDHMQARVAAKALAKKSAKSLNDAIEASFETLNCKSRWKWFRSAGKRFYKTFESENRGVLWRHVERKQRGRRSAVAAIGYVDSTGSQVYGSLDLLRQVGSGELEQAGSSIVLVSRHAMEALFLKAGTLDHNAVQLDIRQTMTSLFLMAVTQPDYWQCGYQELEIITENGLAFAVRDADEPGYTITTWVPSHQMRSEQREGWETVKFPTSSGLSLSVGMRPLPKLSTSIHRKALEEGRYTAR